MKYVLVDFLVSQTTELLKITPKETKIQEDPKKIENQKRFQKSSFVEM